jgi:hypothetical protein
MSSRPRSTSISAMSPRTAMPVTGPQTSATCLAHKPTVSLGVTATVVSSCGHASGHIAQRVAQSLAGHGAIYEGPVEHTQHRHPPHAQTRAPMWQPHGRRPRLTPRGCTDHTPPSDEGQPCGRRREEQRHHRSLVPRALST